ncbi:NAD-dependent epimerase/dehydratase family protein [Chelativorans salis]|uniref:NAD-dependent epimerase/dehydratase family protein n=1 Tax=Chelativorans salis TaxID=2978478 RepID=A0ABT2LU89_9HYPH|nr:NAD-dependent epimerase/dehydratase family protein [Chelativorans sp. EGI FJ00035]MCT7377412.1 NAD-dependent epimerase/dehydratase family protein [Chelativorans sp. EGI FJ00035]
MKDIVLITGGGGFIGRHVASELLDNGFEVRVFDSLVDQVHGGQPAVLPDGVAFTRGDIRDPDAVRRALNGVSLVVHLAAEVGVGQSMYEIERYVGANDYGTAVLLQEIAAQPVRRIVVASSMSVYGEGLYRNAAGRVYDDVRRERSRIEARLWDPATPDGEPLLPIATTEDKPVELASIYALTKFAQERAVLIFAEAYGIDAVALRLFNVFGPGQALSNPYTGVLANFAARLINGEPPLIFEDGAQRRDFVHVQDVARAFSLALRKPEARGNVINIGSGRAYTISSVARLLAEAMDMPDVEPEILGKARAGDIRHCFADISRARALLDFEPAYLLEDSLVELAEWVRRSGAVDRGAEMKRHLEERGLVS